MQLWSPDHEQRLVREIDRSIKREKRFMIAAVILMFLSIWWLSYTAIKSISEAGGIGGWLGEQTQAFNEAKEH